MRTAGDHWETHASQWQCIGPPLRPGVADIAVLEAAIALAAAERPSGVRALLLGVTPEIAACRWPARTELLAVDSSLAMVRAVWPGSGRCAAAAVVGDWQALPLSDASREIVAADGCFVVLPYPSGYDGVLAAVHRVLRPGGLFAIRWFLQAAAPETTGAVIDDLRGGRIGNFHVFKWRLAMSLQPDLRTGVRLADVWSAWHAAVPDPARLCRALGWAAAEVGTIDAYRDARARYSFPSIDEARMAFAPYFDELRMHVPDYELGERCVHFLLRANH